MGIRRRIFSTIRKATDTVEDVVGTGNVRFPELPDLPSRVNQASLAKGVGKSQTFKRRFTNRRF